MKQLMMSSLLALMAGLTAAAPAKAAPQSAEPAKTVAPAGEKERLVGLFYFLWLGEHGRNPPRDITKMLAKDPKNRFQNAGELLELRLGRSGDCGRRFYPRLHHQQTSLSGSNL